jgi:hypothetical protein
LPLRIFLAGASGHSELHAHQRADPARGHPQAARPDGVVVRYGQFYGPGTCYETGKPSPPAIQIDDAARRTLPALEAPSGVMVIAED